MDSAGSLRAALENLPQELYDEIYNFVFTEPPGIRNFNSPALMISMNLLQISRSTRKQYAASFYSAEFECEYMGYRFIFWLLGLPRKHVKYISKITERGHDWWPMSIQVAQESLRRSICSIMGREIAAKFFIVWDDTPSTDEARLIREDGAV